VFIHQGWRRKLERSAEMKNYLRVLNRRTTSILVRTTHPRRSTSCRDDRSDAGQTSQPPCVWRFTTIHINFNPSFGPAFLLPSSFWRLGLGKSRLTFHRLFICCRLWSEREQIPPGHSRVVRETDGVSRASEDAPRFAYQEIWARVHLAQIKWNVFAAPEGPVDKMNNTN
jgi:hypothetical protein